jgi:hypothetical protein
MHYCNSGHQAAHYPAHKKACSKIDKARKSMEVEEQRLRAYEGDGFTMEDPFTNGVGHFWGILETRTYMRLRFALVEALQQVYTRESLEAQLHHLQDMMRLCRGDNMGLRHYVPVLLLRLDRDQECYDFAKWYETVGRRGDYDWGNMDLGFLDLKGEDAFEEVQYLCGEYGQVSFLLSVLLLKIKLLLDLQNMGAVVKEHGDKVPNEILDNIKRKVVRSPIILKHREIVESKDHSGLVAKLKRQIKALYYAAWRANRHVWTVLLQADRYLHTRPSLYSRGSMEEAVLTLNYTYHSWMELPASLDIIMAIQQNTFR